MAASFIHRARFNVRFGSKADMCSAKRHVRFTPESGHMRCNNKCLLCANSEHGVIYSITSLACARSVDGTGMPSALAVFRLITSSYLVGALHGEVRRFLALKYAINIARSESKRINPIRAVTDQAAIHAVGVDRRELVLLCKLDHQVVMR